MSLVLAISILAAVRQGDSLLARKVYQEANQVPLRKEVEALCAAAHAPLQWNAGDPTETVSAVYDDTLEAALDKCLQDTKPGLGFYEVAGKIVVKPDMISIDFRKTPTQDAVRAVCARAELKADFETAPLGTFEGVLHQLSARQALRIVLRSSSPPVGFQIVGRRVRIAGSLAEAQAGVDRANVASGRSEGAELSVATSAGIVPSWMEISRDGRFALVSGEGSSQLIELETGQPFLQLPGAQYSFHPTQSALYRRFEPEGDWFDLTKGRLYSPRLGSTGHFVLSKDGTRGVCGWNQFYVFDAASRQTLMTIRSEPKETKTYSPEEIGKITTLSSHGNFLYLNRHGGQIYRVGDRPADQWPLFQRHLGAVGFSDDERLVAFCFHDRNRPFLKVAQLGQKKIFASYPLSGEPTSLQFSANGRSIYALVDGKILECSASTAKPVAVRARGVDLYAIAPEWGRVVAMSKGRIVTLSYPGFRPVLTKDYSRMRVTDLQVDRAGRVRAIAGNTLLSLSESGEIRDVRDLAEVAGKPFQSGTNPEIGGASARLTSDARYLLTQQGGLWTATDLVTDERASGRTDGNLALSGAEGPRAFRLQGWGRRGATLALAGDKDVSLRVTPSGGTSGPRFASPDGTLAVEPITEPETAFELVKTPEGTLHHRWKVKADAAKGKEYSAGVRFAGFDASNAGLYVFVPRLVGDRLHSELLFLNARDGSIAEHSLLDRQVFEVGAFATSRDGHTLAIGVGSDVWIGQRGVRGLRKLSEHGDTVRALAFDPSGKCFYSGGDDGAIVLWRVDRAEAVCRYRVLGERQVICQAGGGVYMGTPGVGRVAEFRSGMKRYPFEQFDLKLNRPDVVLSQIGKAPSEVIAAYQTAYAERLRRMGISEEALTRGVEDVPEVKVDSKLFPVRAKASEIAFEMKVTDNKSAIDRIQIEVNGVPTPESADLLYRGKNLHFVSVQAKVAILPGLNRIRLSALNAQGSESSPRSFDVTGPEPAVPSKPDLYLLAIGVSEYQNSARSLHFAEKDARDLIAFFSGQQGRQYAHVYVKPLLSKDATRENIREAKTFLTPSKEGDAVIVYLSGHGLVGGPKKLDYFFGTYDVDFAEPATRGLAYDEIENLVSGLKCRQKLLLLDTCHAGEIDDDDTRLMNELASSGTRTNLPGVRGDPITEGSPATLSSQEVMRMLFADLRRGTGAVVVSASTGRQFAAEGGGNGFFTAALLEALRGKAADAEGFVRVSKIGAYVTRAVTLRSGGVQRPYTRSENLDNDFTIARSAP